MARPKSEAKRNAILTATIELVAEQGLGAPTAEIAKRAGVPHGSIFTYFATKADLFVALYVELSGEMTDTVMADMPPDAGTKVQFDQLWVRWTNWGASNPTKRRAQALLKVSAERGQAEDYAAPVYELIRQASAQGTLKDAPFPYVIELVAAWASTTIDFMIDDPADADAYCRNGLDAVWRALN